jgi:hypothetical protein
MELGCGVWMKLLAEIDPLMQNTFLPISLANAS